LVNIVIGVQRTEDLSQAPLIAAVGLDSIDGTPRALFFPFIVGGADAESDRIASR
jgi:hypothetical protein